MAADIASNFPRSISLCVWILASQFHHHINSLNSPADGIDWINKWNLDQSIKYALLKSGFSEDDAIHKITFIKLAVRQQDWFTQENSKDYSKILQTWLTTPEIRDVLKVNFYEDILWYHQESFLELMWWMEFVPILKAFSTKESNRVTGTETVLALQDIFKKIQTRHKKSYCKVDLLLDNKG